MRIQGNQMVFNLGDVSLYICVLDLTQTPRCGSWHVDLEFPILAFEGFRRMAVIFIIRRQVPCVILSVAQSDAQFCFQKFVQNDFEVVPEQFVNV